MIIVTVTMIIITTVVTITKIGLIITPMIATMTMIIITIIMITSVHHLVLSLFFFSHLSSHLTTTTYPNIISLNLL